MEDNRAGLPLEPTLELPIYPMGSNLRFRTPNHLTTPQHVLVINLWASKDNPSHFLHVIRALDICFLKTNEKIFGINPSFSHPTLGQL